jgi:hypothetical protein
MSDTRAIDITFGMIVTAAGLAFALPMPLG